MRALKGMVEKDEPVTQSESVPGETPPDQRTGASSLAYDLVGALEHLEPGKPLILNDGFWLTDDGYLVSSQYVDIGLTKLTLRPRVLVKAIEARYALEFSPSLQLSTPHRYCDYGEPFIQDDQEGRAQRVNKTESEPRLYDESTREQERALTLLGKNGVTIRETDVPDSQTSSERLVFGGNSWIYCTSIIPSQDERDAWRATLPEKYDHQSIIRQPGKFALALAAMFVDQTGPQGRHGHFTHNSGIRSYHRGQSILHGPVWYTDDVLEFLRSFESDPLYAMYPLFVKHSEYRNQKEYRFVLHTEGTVESDTLLLQASGMIRDALAPPGTTSVVNYGPPEDSDAGSSSQMATTRTLGNKTTVRTSQSGEKRRRVLKVADQVEEEVVTSREETVTLTTVSPAVGSDELENQEDSTLPGVVEVAESETREQWIHGERVDSSSYSRTRVFSIADSTGADEYFSVEDRDRAAELLEIVGRPFARFSELPPPAETALVTLARKAQDTNPDAEVQTMSACWNSVWAICNLYDCFGDVIASVDIEQNEFISIVLKGSKGAGVEGKVLVGPRGTYAYVLTRGDEQFPGHGGTKTRLAFFPDEATRAAFEEFGWAPLVDARRPDKTPASQRDTQLNGER